MAKRITHEEMDRRLAAASLAKKRMSKRASHKHLRDSWTAFAQEPLPHLKVSQGEHGHHIGAIEEDGKLIGTWNTEKLKWLYPYLAKRLGQLHGAWHMALAGIASRRGGARGGEASKLDAETENALNAALKTHMDKPARAVAESLQLKGKAVSEKTVRERRKRKEARG